MDWTRIMGLVMLLMLLGFIGPRVLNSVRNSPKGSPADWMEAAKPLLLVVGFVILLFYMAKG